MQRSQKLGIIALVAIGIAIFGYTQYASASLISVNVISNELLSTDASGSEYAIELEFENPSLLVLTAGETAFEIQADGKTVARGVLEPFTLTPLDEIRVNGVYRADDDNNAHGTSDSEIVMIVGETEYDMLFVSIGVPFEYQPTREQARDFIHQT